MLDSSARAGKHNEFYEAAKILTLDKVIVASHLIKSAFEAAPEEAQTIRITRRCQTNRRQYEREECAGIGAGV